MLLLFLLLAIPLLVVLLVGRFDCGLRMGQKAGRTVILQTSLRAGTFLGVFFLAGALIGNVVPLPPVLAAMDDGPAMLSCLGVAMLTLGWAGFRARRRSGSIFAAALGGLVAGVVGFALCGLWFVGIDVIFFESVRTQPEKIWNFSHSEYHDMRLFLFDSAVRGGVIITAVGAGLGLLSGAIGGFLGGRRSTEKAVT